MTEDDARSLLRNYADGALTPERAKEVEGVLETSAVLREELKVVRDELKTLNDTKTDLTAEPIVLDDALISEALAPLHPSRSARIRLTEAMLNVHRQAEHVAKTLPEYGWRIFRLCFVFVTLLAAVLLVYFYPRPTSGADEKTLIAWADIGIFIMGLAFVLGGRTLIRFETLLVGAFSRREVKPTALEILTLEVFGMLCLLISGAIYWYTVVRVS